MILPVQDLRGPHADEACHLLGKATTLTWEQASQVSAEYERDTDPNYDNYCTEVWDALERTGRLLPLGWFEGIFLDAAWVETKALHAIADAVVATLVRSEISRDAYNCLTLPFLLGRTVTSEMVKVDLSEDKACVV